MTKYIWGDGENTNTNIEKENSEILSKCCSVGIGTEFSPIKEV